MKKQLVLIKFGGSLITDKKKEDTLRADMIERCAEHIEQLKQSYPDSDLIIGTGVGSFGHIQARSYQLDKNLDSAKKFYGLCTIHNNVRKLNEYVVRELTDRGLSAFSISPSAMLMASGGVITSSFFEPMRQLLASGCIPMLHGDALLDPIRGATIISTEKVLHTCLENLRALYEEIIVVYCMDVEGVWDENHVVIPVLEKDQELYVQQNGVKDVTGGIEGKVRSARKAAELADRVYLISGSEPGSLCRVIGGEKLGTQVL